MTVDDVSTCDYSEESTGVLSSHRLRELTVSPLVE